MAHYMDTSAITKLIVDEPETEALRTWWATPDRSCVTSAITRTELMRAVRRTYPERAVLAGQLLHLVMLISVTAHVLEQAGRLDPVELRSFDAIHLATASDLGDDLDAVVTYDLRLAEAAEGYGIAVIAPR